MAEPFIAVTVHGLKEFEANLKILREEFGVKTGGVINRALMAGAQAIKNEAIRLAPVLQDAPATRKAFNARAKHLAGHALSSEANRRISGNLKFNIVAHYVKRQPLTVWVRVRTKTYIFAQKRAGRVRKYRSGWVAAPGGTDPSNLVGNPNYWWLVEFGRRDGKGKRPFLRPAFESKKVEALNIFKANMRKQVDKLFGANVRKAA